MRYDNWKFVFMEQRTQGTYQVWSDPFTILRAPKLFNLRMDPFERADITSNTYWHWLNEHQYMFIPAQAFVIKQLQSFKEFPPMQKPASFTIDQAVEKLTAGALGSN